MKCVLYATGEYTAQPLELSDKKRLHVIMWEQASLASQV